MSASVRDALSICQRLLNSGNQSVDVYWKLASAQHQDGETLIAKRTLTQALRRYPGNARLATLRDIILTDATEQALIDRSAQLNQRSLDKGALKIACLTKTGQVAISACKRRLELTAVDSDRIQTRLDALLDADQATRLITNPAPNPPTPEPERPSDLTTTSPALTPDQLALEQRQIAYKDLVKTIQQSLNALGFDAGWPDGVPGKKTRTALTQFYAAMNAHAATNISELALQDLKAAQAQLTVAQRLLAESQQSLANDDPRAAIRRLSLAKRTSSLLKVPLELEQAIQSALIETAKPEPVPEPKPLPIPEPAPQQIPEPTPQPDPTPEVDTQTFKTLMSQIKTLQGRIRRQQEDQDALMQRLRDAL